MVVRRRRRHKGELKVLCTCEKCTHRARTVWCTARTALMSPSYAEACNLVLIPP